LPALPSSKTAMSPYFDVRYPSAWGTGAITAFTLSLRKSLFDSSVNAKLITSDPVAAYQWNGSSWQQATWQSTTSADTILWRTDSAAQGTYVLLATKIPAPAASDRIVIFPNPARLGTKKFMRFEGNGLNEVRIYSIAKGLVATSKNNAFHKFDGGLEWQLVNNHGQTVVPGFYTAIITQQDTTSGKNTTTLHKVLVFP
jgi:hypothetical protein